MVKKKKSWFNLLKKLFISDTNSGLEKKDKKRRWVFGRLRSKRLASLTAPSPHLMTPQNLDENRVPQKCVSASAVVSQSSGTHPPPPPAATTNKPEKESEEDASGTHQLDIAHHLVAVIKIQSAFRGYLARKALRALKGLVKLQAIIRGWAVRRQAMHTLKCLQTIINIQSEFCAKRCDLLKTPLLPEPEKDIKIDSNSQKRWDDSVLSKEEANALSMNKKVASIRRERIKEYWLNHRRSTESEQSKLSIKQRYWLEQWVDSQLAKREDLQNLGTINSANANPKDEISNRRLRLARNLQRHYQVFEASDPTINVPRRSFDHRRQLSIGGDRDRGSGSSFVGSPAAVPTYMAATESAKAKARSMSSPRLRPIHFDAYSEINSPYKHKLSPISSINSEVTSCSQISRHILYSQRSPCLKATSGPVKSTRSLNTHLPNACG